MWYVKSIEQEYLQGRTTKTTWLRIDNERYFQLSCISFGNTESDEVKRFELPIRGILESFLAAQEPLGYFHEDAYPDSHVFVVVDETAQKFMSYVSEVDEPLYVSPQETWIESLGIRKEHILDCVRSLDPEKTLFMIYTTACEYAFVNLFQLVCYLQDGWNGDSFYIAERDVSVVSRTSPTGVPHVAYQINFTDAHAARLLVTKTLMLKK